MRIQVNGEAREVEKNASISELITGLNLRPEQVAIELNHNVVRRAQWENTLLQPEDKVEIVHFVGGGETRQQLQ